ncbi:MULTISPECIES: mannosyl-3-phosphoglycerate phosphatase [Halomonadaceae]|uniref:HAD-IIB family hydrolase n=1 Tax=Halomonadaceae TaxID=28256 RepID=UPI0015986E5B|nr:MULTISPECIES: HAD-IIB family hydrolase [Halomonas]QJQ96930.1 HAD-IIB family hydrolase [Halomonas sp. PA5]
MPSTASPPRLVFTDLDGSLLDHDTYSWAPARAWLSRLKRAGVPVIPVTSKTRAELLSLRLELGLGDAPFIAENGAVIGLPPAWQHARLDRDPTAPDGLCIKTPGLDIDFVRKRLAVIRERMGLHFRAMGEMSLDEIIALTGLPEPAARQARVREGSEPLIWQEDGDVEAFRRALADDGLRLTRGGRFWHVMGEVHKGDSVRWLVDRFEALRGCTPHTLGLGDGPNDVPLLAAVDLAVLIRARHGQAVEVEAAKLYRSEAYGPEGWAEGIEYWWGGEIPEDASHDAVHGGKESHP